MSTNIKVAVFMHDFRGGGAERVSATLCNGLADKNGIKVTVFVINKAGPMLADLSDKVEVVELGCKRMAFAFWKLSFEIKKLQPDLVISHMTHANVTACIASILGGFSKKLIVVEHNQMQNNFKVVSKFTVKLAYLLTKVLYKIPNNIVAVSSGVKESVVKFTKVNKENVVVIYNPVVSEELIDYKPIKCVDLHRFYSLNLPVFICVGSLTKQKNFPLFLRALKIVSQIENVKAIILGEGPEREELELMVENLKLQDIVDLPGFVTNPYDYISNADTFVLSSSWEGLPTVIIEAIALNTNVVSTNCPSGPEEILNGGEFGLIVPVDDEKSLSEAMIQSINTATTYDLSKRADDFSVVNSVDGYYSLIEDCI